MYIMNDNKPKVSIIIPVYNVEKYLRKCLDSVVNQTLKNIEIFIVNDGSTDSSLEIMQEYATKDKRITIIDKPNSGYGNSMNRGLNAATGEYIGIVESDDYVALEMYEELYALSENGTVDIVKGNFYDCYDQEDGKPLLIVANREKEMIPDSRKPFILKEDGRISQGHPSIWCGIYRRDFIEKNKIRFMEVKGGGWVDNPFFYETLCKAEGIKWTSKPYYYYYKGNPNSSSNNQTDPNLPFERMMQNLEVLKKEGYHDDEAMRCAYSRAFIYTNGVVNADFDYDAHEKIIVKRAKELMRCLDEKIVNTFGCFEQDMYYRFNSPLQEIYAKRKKILIYNWVPFDNPWRIGGDSTVYIKNLIEEILKTNMDVSIYVLSSGFAYDATKNEMFTRKIYCNLGEHVHQHEIVNSPIPVEDKYLCYNPSVVQNNEDLKQMFDTFINKYGPFEAIHFNTIKGLSLNVFDIKDNYPEMKIIYSVHENIDLENKKLYPKHPKYNFIENLYAKGIYGKNKTKCYSKLKWAADIAVEGNLKPFKADTIKDFANKFINVLNNNCDYIIVDSEDDYNEVVSQGISENKIQLLEADIEDIIEQPHAVTLEEMHKQWKELSKIYGILDNEFVVNLNAEEFYWLTKERDYLVRKSQNKFDNETGRKLNDVNREMNHIQNVFEKNQHIMDMVQCLIACSGTDYGLENRCLSRGYKNIIIYGYGVLGKVIFRDLRGSKVTVVGIMDSFINNVKGAPEGIVLSSPDDENKIKEYDAIIVTAINAYEVIKNNLIEKGFYNVVTADELIDSDVNSL